MRAGNLQIDCQNAFNSFKRSSSECSHQFSSLGFHLQANEFRVCLRSSITVLAFRFRMVNENARDAERKPLMPTASMRSLATVEETELQDTIESEIILMQLSPLQSFYLYYRRKTCFLEAAPDQLTFFVLSWTTCKPAAFDINLSSLLLSTKVVSLVEKAGWRLK